MLLNIIWNELLFTQYHVGRTKQWNKPNQTFSPHFFTNMSKKCYEEFNYAVEKIYIKNHIKTLKASFHACHDLFKNLSGFTKNPIT